MRLWEDEPTEPGPDAAPATEETEYALLTSEAGDGLVVTGATGSGPRLEIPDAIDGRSVVGIGDSAFRGSVDLRSVRLPDSLRWIGQCAFQGCAGLSELALPRRMRAIGESAFQGCAGLASVRLPEGLAEIAHRAFADCPSLKRLDVPASVTSLFADALPRGDMRDGQFYLRPQAMLVRAVVKRCYAVPRGTRRLAGGALAGNESLLGVDFGDALESIGPFALAECACLKRVDLPDAVREVGRAAFSGCLRMTGARMSPGMTELAPELFMGCRALERVTLFPGLKAVGERAFEDCHSLKALSLPEGVRRVGRRAFCRCASLERLELPASLEALGEGALSGCVGLRVLVLKGRCTEAMRPALAEARRAVIVAPTQPPEAFEGLWRKRVCLGYALAVSEGIPFAPEVEAACLDWMRAHGSAFVAEALTDRGLMHLLADGDCLSLNDVQTLLERVEGPDRDEYYVTLLAYRDRRFGEQTDAPMTLW